MEYIQHKQGRNKWTTPPQIWFSHVKRLPSLHSCGFSTPTWFRFRLGFEAGFWGLAMTFGCSLGYYKLALAFGLG